MVDSVTEALDGACLLCFGGKQIVSEEPVLKNCRPEECVTCSCSTNDQG